MPSNGAHADPRRSAACVYTVRLGDYDNLLEQPVAADSSADFICFTDDPTLKSKTWEIRQFDPLLPADLGRSSRHPKICAHRFLSDYDLSIYIDASVILTAPPERLIDELFRPAGCDMVCFQHSDRDSLMQELFAVVRQGLDDTARCVEQINHYYLSPHFAEGPPIWGGLLMRRHNSAPVARAMELWFTHVLRYSRRDQLSFGYVANSLGFPFRALPLDNNDSGYHRWPMGRARLKPEQPVRADLLPLALSFPHGRIADGAQGGARSPSAAPPRPPAGRAPAVDWSQIGKEFLGLRRRWLPPAPPRRRTKGNAKARRSRIVFMLDSASDASASTTIFSRQLREIADRKAESLGFETSISDHLDHHDSILVLSKNFLQQRPEEHLWRLRRKRNILIGCFLDAPISFRKARYLDSLVAVSAAQHQFFLQELPDIPSFRVNHGIDARIAYPPCQQAKFAAGYFGEPTNGLYLDVLKQLIVTHHTPTKSSELDWAAALASYNCHYLMRPPLQPGVFKPFTKGFLAAACGATVLADAADPVALEMLTEDYPFLVRAPSIANVRETIAAAEDAFGGPDWALARGIMASLRREYAPDTVAEQFATVLRYHL